MENKDIKKVDNNEKNNAAVAVASTPVKKASKLGKFNRWGYVFCLPFVIVFCIFCIYPVVETLYLSFCDYRGGLGVEPKFLKDDLFKNYTNVVTNKYFWKAFLNTVVIWTLNIVLQLGLAFILTVIFSDVKYKMRGLPIYRALYYLPNLIAATSIAFLFKTLLDTNYGSVNVLIREFIYQGPPIQWLEDKNSVFEYIHSGWGQLSKDVPYVGGYRFYTLPQISVAIIQAWMWFGNSFIMLMAGVMGISRDYFEAAAIDGAGRWKIFSKVVLPLLRPIMLYVGVTSLIGGLQLFDLPFLIAPKASVPAYESLNTAVMFIYKYGFNIDGGSRNVALASAAAYTLFLIIMVLCVAQVLYAKRKEAK